MGSPVTGGGVGSPVAGGTGVGVTVGLVTGGSLGSGVGVPGSGVTPGSGVGLEVWPPGGVGVDESTLELPPPPPQAENRTHTSTRLVNLADNDTLLPLELVLSD